MQNFGSLTFKQAKDQMNLEFKMAKFRPLPRVKDLQKRSADYFKISIYAKKSKLLLISALDGIHKA